MIKKCINCGQEKEHHAKGLCYSCYKKLNWSPKLELCKRCKQNRAIHAKGLCASCYNYVYQSEKIRSYQQRKSNNIDLKTFRKVTKSCVICGFDKIVDIYHLDKNKKNNSSENLIGLCPNHHRMINNSHFKFDLYQRLQELGYKVPFYEKKLF